MIETYNNSYAAMNAPLATETQLGNTHLPFHAGSEINGDTSSNVKSFNDLLSEQSIELETTDVAPASLDLTQDSLNILKLRGLSTQQINDFADLLGRSHQKIDNGSSAKNVLSEMTRDELKLIQKATCLAEHIKVNVLSAEGAQNLLAQPDRSNMVDIGNDGIVEVGAARTISFPPVNAPDSVKIAWETATEGMSFADKAIFELQMHLHVYGIDIPGIPKKTPLSPDQQWSKQGQMDLIEQARSALKFAVSRDGWTSRHLLERDFYNDFEKALSTSTQNT